MSDFRVGGLSRRSTNTDPHFLPEVHGRDSSLPQANSGRFLPSWEREPESRDHQEFAALCLSFSALVGLPLAIFSFVCGLLISFD